MTNADGLFPAIDTKNALTLAPLVITGGAAAAVLPFSVAVTALSDSTVEVDRGTFVQGSTFARALFTTSAQHIRVRATTDHYGDGHTAEVGVSVDGQYIGSAEAIGDGEFSRLFTLAAGSHTIEVVNGQQSKPSDLLGSYVMGIDADAAITQTFPTPANRVLFIIDSIGAGGNAAYPTHNGFIALLRQATTDSIVTYGWGFGSIASLSGDDPTALVAIIAAANPAKIVIQAGLNDYYLDQSSAATFGTRYAAMADAIHAALPSVPIFAVTPIVKLSEAANSFGNTLGNYRTQIGTVVSTRGAFMTLVDGTTFMTTDDLDDGVHPTAHGHWEWARGIATHLGYTIAAQPLMAGANGEVTVVGAAYRATKTSGGGAFNAGFFGEAQAGDFRYKLVPIGLQDTMIGVNTGDASASNGFSDMLHQLYLGGDGSIIAYDGGTSGGAIGTYGGGDDLWVDRSSTVLSFVQGPSFGSGTVLRSFTGVTGSLTLDLSMFTVGAEMDVTPQTVSAVLTAGPDAHGSVSVPSAGTYRAQKNSGGALWNCGFYGATESGDFRYSFVPAALQDTMIGLSFDAAAASGFSDMLHQIYLGGTGPISGYDGPDATPGSPSIGYAPGDTLWMDRTGTTLTFKIGADYDTATLLRIVYGVGGDYAPDISMFTSGAHLDVKKVI